MRNHSLRFRFKIPSTHSITLRFQRLPINSLSKKSKEQKAHKISQTQKPLRLRSHERLELANKKENPKEKVIKVIKRIRLIHRRYYAR